MIMKRYFFLVCFIFLSNLFSGDFVLPERLKNNVVYLNSFETENGKAEINLWNIEEQIISSRIIQDEIFEKSYVSSLKPPPKTGYGDETMILKSNKFSPERGLTISFWWRFKEKKVFPFTLFVFRGENGNFSCALQEENWGQFNFSLKGTKPQVGRFNANPYKTEIKNTVITFSAGGLEIKLYQNSQLVVDITSKRPINENDGFKQIFIGDQGKIEILIDDILILDRPVDLNEIKDYYNMKKVYYEYKKGREI